MLRKPVGVRAEGGKSPLVKVRGEIAKQVNVIPAAGMKIYN